MRLNYLLCVLLLLFFNYKTKAQCPPTTPGMLSGTMTNMLITDTTASPIYTTTPTGLPNTEFLIIQNDSLAPDGFGPRIIMSSLDGRVVPLDLGLTTCNEICVVPFSYDLQQVQYMVDSLLLAEYVPGTSCCTAAGQFFTGLCDSLNAYGINSGSDINNLTDIITLMGVFAGISNNNTSLTNLISTISQFNTVATLFGGCTGGVTEICFAVSNTISAMDCYTVALPNSASSVIITPDTIRIAPSGTAILTASYLPNTSIDSIVWSVSNTSNITVNPATGEVIGSAGIDTAWIIATGVRGCATDVVVVIVDPALSITRANLIAMPLQTFPNPFEQLLEVRFYAIGGSYQLQLIGVTGKVYYDQEYNLTTGNQQLTIENNAIPKGYYFLRITGKNMQGTQAVVKH